MEKTFDVVIASATAAAIADPRPEFTTVPAPLALIVGDPTAVCEEAAFVGWAKLFAPGVSCTVSQYLLLPVALKAIPPEVMPALERLLYSKA